MRSHSVAGSARIVILPNCMRAEIYASESRIRLFFTTLRRRTRPRKKAPATGAGAESGSMQYCRFGRRAGLAFDLDQGPLVIVGHLLVIAGRRSGGRGSPKLGLR